MGRQAWSLSGAGLLATAVLVGLCCSGCGDDPSKPLRLETAAYGRMVSNFYVGVAALDVADNDRARSNLEQATRIAPNEPAPWLDLAVLALRNTDTAQAQKYLDEAKRHLPDQGRQSAEAQLLEGLLAAQPPRMDRAAALQHIRAATQLQPENLHFAYALIEQLKMDTGPEVDRETQHWWEVILQRQPLNVEALGKSAKLAAATDDVATLRKRLDALHSISGNWSPDTRSQLAAAERSLGAAPQVRATEVGQACNMVLATAAQKVSLAALTNFRSALGEPVRHFLRLPVPAPSPAPPDTSLSFTPEASGNGQWSEAVRLDNTSQPVSLNFEGTTLTVGAQPPARLATPGAISPDGVLTVDLDHDQKQDLALAGPGGLRLYQQQDPAHWTDVTAKSGLPAALLSASYTAVWTIDADLDGDLDLVLGKATGAPVVLRNNGDGTWKPLPLFAGVDGVRALGYADLDSDGDPDVALVDRTGHLVFFDNERAGHYKRLPAPVDLAPVLTLSVADADANGTLDLVLLLKDGSVVRLSRKGDGGWDQVPLTRWAGAPTDGTARLISAELDNNGAVDLVASGSHGSQVWLGGPGGALQALSPQLDARVLSVEDVNGDGRPDLTGSSAQGTAIRLISHGRITYGWQEVRPQANQKVQRGDPKSGTVGVGGDEDQRTNSFGVGGEVEIRAGTLVQKQPLGSPSVHFGLGSYPQSDVVRIVWPKGSAQAEFDFNKQPMKTALAMVVEQRLTGSCPWLFAYNGQQVEFIGDVLFNSPLGLRINGQDTAGVAQTRDWVKIRGDQLRPHDGYYDLRLTGELWETDIFDYVSLMTVDHPADTEVYLDERFSIPPPELRVRVTTPARPFARALDDRGADVTEVVRARDSRYLDTFGQGKYQGITRDHWVELELPADAPQNGPLYLLAYGWIHPTDSSINVAISQGKQDKPKPLSLEVPDGKGGWRTARSGLGFPAGKNKTVIVDLTGAVPPGTTGPRRVRLRTNLEIYWDQLSWATPRTEVKPVQQALLPNVAELRYRGFSYVHQAGFSSPETPDYNRIQTTGQMWRDLIGYYTRFGDVRELLAKVDDRYVLLNAGDEIALRFPEQPPPPTGWVRDYVFISDGWDKDGNMNTSYSKTLLPLPSHSRPAYNTPPTRLEDDPVYRQHPDDWKKYHTRYVTPDEFSRGLRAGLP